MDWSRKGDLVLTMLKNRVFLLVLLLLLIPSVAYAHAMFLKMEEPGVLKAEYDGGGFSPRTEITIYDEAGNELDKGLVDDEGKFYFDENLDVHRAVADDGMGHRAEYKKGVEAKTIPKAPVVIGVFALVAVIFAVYKVYNRKGKNLN